MESVNLLPFDGMFWLRENVYLDVEYPSGACRISVRGVDILGGWPCRGSRGRSLLDHGELSKICKKILPKMAKILF